MPQNTANVTPANIVDAILDGAHDVHAIAAALGVYHSNATLRTTLTAMADAGLIHMLGNNRPAKLITLAR